MRKQKDVENRAGIVALWGLPAPDLRYRRNGIRGNTQTLAFMVSYHVVDDGPKIRIERKELVRHVWIWKLSDGMGMASETAQRHDPGWPGTTLRPSRGG